MDMKFFFPLLKADEKKREIYGVAAIEEPDSADEIMDYEKSKPYFEAWIASVKKASKGKSFGNVRDSHTSKAVGKIIDIAFDDAKKAVLVKVKVVDDNAWEKILEGVFTGFSIGGKYIKKWVDKVNEKLTRYIADVTELSLVDRPAMAGATFEMVKADGATELFKFKESGENKTMDELLALLKERGIEDADSLKAILEKAEESEKDETEPKEDESDAADSAEKAEGEEDDAEKADDELSSTVREMVLSVLDELGLLKENAENEGEFSMGEKITDLVKAAKTETENTRDKLAKRQSEINSDLAALAVSVKRLEERGVAPVLRQVGTLSKDAASALQRQEALESVIEKTDNPQVRQALQQELTVMQIKNVQK